MGKNGCHFWNQQHKQLSNLSHQRESLILLICAINQQLATWYSFQSNIVGVVANVMDYDIVVIKLKLQSCYNAHF